jgi:sulfate permease, SulP family
MNEGNGGGADTSYEGEASPFQHPARRPFLQRLAPVTENLPGYRGGALRRDLLAGVTVAALALPASLAYAEIAGLSPVIGLYALLLPAVAYALFGTSRQVIVGPDGSLAALVGAAVIPLVADPEQRASLAALLALLVGAAFLGARLARLGWIADYFSRPVLIGYLHGVAVVLIIGQLGKLLGLSMSAQTPPGQIAEIVREITDLSWTTLAVGLACLTALLLLHWLLPKLPGPLIVVVLAIVVSAAVGLADLGSLWSAISRPVCPASKCPTFDRETSSHSSRPRLASSSSVFAARSSQLVPLPAVTASTSTRTRNWSPWER